MIQYLILNSDSRGNTNLHIGKLFDSESEAIKAVEYYLPTARLVPLRLMIVSFDTDDFHIYE